MEAPATGLLLHSDLIGQLTTTLCVPINRHRVNSHLFAMIGGQLPSMLGVREDRDFTSCRVYMINEGRTGKDPGIIADVSKGK